MVSLKFSGVSTVSSSVNPGLAGAAATMASDERKNARGNREERKPIRMFCEVTRRLLAVVVVVVVVVVVSFT
jgi:hypothetical protein